MWLRLRDSLLAVQPLLAAPIFFSVLLGVPPLWLSWLVAVTPLALRFWRDGRPFRGTPFDIPILLFSLGLLVGLLVSPNPGVSLGAFHTFLAGILIYYGIVSNSDNRNGYWLWVAGLVCLVVLGLSIWFFSEGEGRPLFFNEWVFSLAEPLPKITGPILNLHSLAAVLAVVVPVFLAMALFKNYRRLRLTALALGLGFLLVLLLVASGSGWMAVALGLTLVLLCWRFWTAAIILPAAGIATWLVAVYYDRASWLAQVFSTDSLLGRMDYWGKTIDLLKDHPVTGLGLGAWPEVYSSHYGTSLVNVHNSYLQLYCDTGFLGLVALIWAGVVFLRLSWPILSSSKQGVWYGVAVGIIGGIAAGAAQAIVEVTFSGTMVTATGYYYIGIPLLWIMAALFIVAYNRLSRGDINPEVEP